jgi:hypothetical protein
MAAFAARVVAGDLPALLSLGLVLGGLGVIACLCWALGHGD